MNRKALFAVVFFVFNFAVSPVLAKTTESQTSDQAPAENLKVLSYAQWKDLEVTRAENSAVQVSNRLVLNKASHEGPGTLEVELKGALQSLDIARALSFEHYIAVYLSPIVNSNPEKLTELVRVLSEEEMAELITILINKSSFSEVTGSRQGSFRGIMSAPRVYRPAGA